MDSEAKDHCKTLLFMKGMDDAGCILQRKQKLDGDITDIT